MTRSIMFVVYTRRLGTGRVVRGKGLLELFPYLRGDWWWLIFPAFPRRARFGQACL
ncbi:MAG: hypothetical protein KF886_14115 [Candidatus Hydrogenedentes bacterium]|nr:hypothetical protein [Candidatus Hydrogenedentota bacterium]